jgi:hypothetical protein
LAFWVIHNIGATPAPPAVPSPEDTVKAEITACKRLPSVYDWYGWEPPPLGETEEEMTQRLAAKDKEWLRRVDAAWRIHVIYDGPVHMEKICGKTLYWREHDGGREYVTKQWAEKEQAAKRVVIDQGWGIKD